VTADSPPKETATSPPNVTAVSPPTETGATPPRNAATPLATGVRAPRVEAPEKAPERTGTGERAATAGTLGALSLPRARVGRLRVGIDAPNGLPADVALTVTPSDGRGRTSNATQVVLVDATSGLATITVQSPTRTLARTTVFVPPSVEVRVLCKTLSADFGGMLCTVRE
jgi:hypothetical protein